MRTIQEISKQLQRIDEIIMTEFNPAIMGGIICFQVERTLILLPPKFGGLGIPIFAKLADNEHENSVQFKSRNSYQQR